MSPSAFASERRSVEASLRHGDDVRVLEGGMAAWRSLKLPRATGFERMSQEPNDYSFRPYGRDTAAEEAMHEYLDREVDLVESVERDGDAHLDIVRPAP